jgi:hypothetical protein
MENSFILMFVWTAIKNSVYKFLNEVHEEEPCTEDEFGDVKVMA